MQNYEINADTLAIIPLNDYKSKIIERYKEIEIDQTPMKIIDNSCKYFGSSYKGRFYGTRNLIGVSHKAPIIVEESREIIFFPTSSPRLYECAWISLKNINDYKRSINSSIIIFNSGYNLELDMSYGSLDNQILRAARLESVLRKRKIV